jgi:acetyl-CoA acyltransferase
VRDTVWILGASMTKFSRYPEKDIIDLSSEAARGALVDAGVTLSDIEFLSFGTTSETNNAAQRLMAQIGYRPIPGFNVANGCATGAVALRLAIQAILAGEATMALAVGAQLMGKAGLLGNAGRGGKDGLKPFVRRGRWGTVMSVEGRIGTGTFPGTFSHAGTEYALKHGVTFDQFARVAVKNHEHSTLNPLAQYRRAFSLEEIKEAEMVAYPNTVPMCCPTTDGSASVVVVSDERLGTLDIDQRRRAIKISASSIQSQPWSESESVQPDLNTLTGNCASAAYEEAGVAPGDLDLVELHDCFASAELMHYDNLSLCEPGGAGDFIDSGAPWRDGATPVNVSGGLLSKGHPIGATGLANIFEVATHLRGEAGDRQIEGAKVGLAHVVALGSTCAVHILERAAAPKKGR